MVIALNINEWKNSNVIFDDDHYDFHMAKLIPVFYFLGDISDILTNHCKNILRMGVLIPSNQPRNRAEHRLNIADRFDKYVCIPRSFIKVKVNNIPDA